MKEQRQNGFSLLLLALALVAATAINLVWHSSHQTPVMAGHGTPLIAVDQVKEFLAAPLTELWKLFRGNVAPNYSLYNVTTAIGLGLLGHRHLGMVFVSTLYYLLLIGAVFGIVARLGDRKGAIAAAWAALLMPAAMAWSRNVSPNIGIMALSALGVYLLVRSDWLARPLPLIGFVVTTVAASRIGETMSDNFQVLMVFALVLGYLLVVRFTVMKTDRKKALISLGAAAAVFMLLFNFNYLRGMASPYLFREGVQFAGDAYAKGNVLHNPLALLTYPYLLWHYHLLPLYSLIALAAVAFLFFKPKRETGLALVYLLAPLLLSSLISKKNYNYILAVLPAVPVVIGLAVTRLAKSRVALAVLLCLAVGTVGQFFWLSYAKTPTQLSFFNSISQSFVKQICQTAFFPVYPAASKEPAAAITARKLAERAQTDGGTLLIVGGGYEQMESIAFRYQLTLANWHDELTVIDPIFQIEKTHGKTYLPAAAKTPLVPDYIVWFSYGDKLFRERGFEQTPVLFEYLSRYKIMTLHLPTREKLWEASDRIAQIYRDVQWDDYRQEALPWANPDSPLSVDFHVFSKPERELFTR